MIKHCVLLYSSRQCQCALYIFLIKWGCTILPYHIGLTTENYWGISWWIGVARIYFEITLLLLNVFFFQNCFEYSQVFAYPNVFHGHFFLQKSLLLFWLRLHVINITNLRKIGSLTLLRFLFYEYVSLAIQIFLN